MTNNWQIEKYSAENVQQIPGGVTDKHWSMIENLRQTCRRFLVVRLTNIDLWSKICGIRAADSWWCDWQTLIYDQKSAAFVPQIPGGVTDKHWSMIENLRHSCRRFLVVWLTDVERQMDRVTPPFSVPNRLYITTGCCESQSLLFKEMRRVMEISLSSQKFWFWFVFQVEAISSSHFTIRATSIAKNDEIHCINKDFISTYSVWLTGNQRYIVVAIKDSRIPCLNLGIVSMKCLSWMHFM
jgi:hypothetical protein